MKQSGEEVVDIIKEFRDILEGKAKSSNEVFTQDRKVLAQQVIALESALMRINIAEEEREICKPTR